MRRDYGSGRWVRFYDIPGVAGTIYVRLGGEGATQLHLVADDAERGLTAADLRNLPLSRLIAVAASRPDIVVGMEGVGDPHVLEELEAAFPWPAQRGEQDTSARLAPPANGLTDDFLREVSGAYLAAVARGERPNRALMQQVGDGFSKRTVERWVYMARKHGFLPATKQGSIA
jgi:hypothetical protein